jgi:O-antigen/teichoic acid export membrane protein
MGALFLAVVGLAGPPLFATVFGEAWRESGEIVRWLAPMYLLTFVRVPTRHVLYLFNRHDLHLWFDGVAALVMAFAFFAAASGWLTAAETIILYSLGSALANLIYLCLLDRLLASRAAAARSSVEQTGR